MSLLNYNWGNIKDERTVSPGEYEIQLKGIEEKTSKKGDPMLESRFTILNEADTRPIFHYTMLPAESDDEDIVNGKLRRLREFLIALGSDMSGEIDTEGLVGSTCFAILKEEEDAEFGARNNISRFIARR